MKNSILTLLIIGIFTFTLKSQEVSLSFEITDYMYSQDNFGYNPGGLMYYHGQTDCTNNTSTPAYFNDNYSCDFDACVKEELVNLVDVMPGNVLRFPAGTYSQFYHLSSPINDCETSDVGFEYYENEINWIDHLQAFNQATQDFDDLHQRNIIYDFIDLVKAIEDVSEEDYKVIVVFNMLKHWFDYDNTHECGSNVRFDILDGSSTIINDSYFDDKYEENIRVLQMMLDEGIDVVGIELGNELYFSRFTSNSPVDPLIQLACLSDNDCCINYDLDPEEYSDVSSEYSSRLSTDSDTRLHDIPIAVCVGNTNGFSDWNGALEDDIENDNSIYDAMIIHYYHDHDDGLLDNYTAPGNELTDLFDFLNTNYNTTNLPFWITEFNDDANSTNGLRMSSSLLALINNIERYNSDNSNVNQIEYYTAHNLGGLNSNGLAFIDMQYDGIDNNDYAHPNNIFYPVYLIDDAGDLMSSVGLEVNYTSLTEDDITLNSYFDPASSEVLIHYANPTDDDITLNTSNSSFVKSGVSYNLNTATNGTITIDYYYANSLNGVLFGENDVSINANTMSSTPVPPLSETFTTIPAFSLGIIRIPVNIPCSSGASSTEFLFPYYNYCTPYETAISTITSKINEYQDSPSSSSNTLLINDAIKIEKFEYGSSDHYAIIVRPNPSHTGFTGGDRPAVFVAPGGFFNTIDGHSKDRVDEWAADLALRGYTAIYYQYSIDPWNNQDCPTELEVQTAIGNAYDDIKDLIDEIGLENNCDGLSSCGRAALSEVSDPYNLNLDVDQIYAGGMDAGGMIPLILETAVDTRFSTTRYPVGLRGIVGWNINLPYGEIIPDGTNGISGVLQTAICIPEARFKALFINDADHEKMPVHYYEENGDLEDLFNCVSGVEVYGPASLSMLLEESQFDGQGMDSWTVLLCNSNEDLFDEIGNVDEQDQLRYRFNLSAEFLFEVMNANEYDQLDAPMGAPSPNSSSDHKLYTAEVNSSNIWHWSDENDCNITGRLASRDDFCFVRSELSSDQSIFCENEDLVIDLYVGILDRARFATVKTGYLSINGNDSDIIDFDEFDSQSSQTIYDGGSPIGSIEINVDESFTITILQSVISSIGAQNICFTASGNQFVDCSYTGCIQVEVEGKAIEFDGNNDQVKIPHGGAFNFGTDPFTIEMQIQTSTTKNNTLLLTNNMTGNIFALDGIFIGLEYGKLYCSIYNNSSTYKIVKNGGGQDLRDGYCHHIAATRSSDNYIKLYIDGVEVENESISSSINMSYGSNFFLGNTNLSGSSLDYDGIINNLRIWDVERSENDLETFKNLPLTTNELAIVEACWSFNESSDGQTFANLSNNNSSIEAYLGNTSGSEGVDASWADFCCLKSDGNPLRVISQKESIDDLNENEAQEKLITNTEFEVSIYPNPFSKQTKVLLTKPEESTVVLEVVDVLGKQIAIYKSIQSNQFVLKNKGWAKGNYILNVYDENYKRLVVSKQLIVY